MAAKAPLLPNPKTPTTSASAELRPPRSVSVPSPATPPWQPPSLHVARAGGHMTELLHLPSERPELHVLVIPGNPGVVPFYSEYVADLFSQLNGRASVTAVSHVGHTEKEWVKGGLFSLAEQIDHKVKYLDEQFDSGKLSAMDSSSVQGKEDNGGEREEGGRQEGSGKTLPLVLIGHSIGAHIAMEVLRKFGPGRVKHVIGVYPFVSLNERSIWQKVLNWASRITVLGVFLSGVSELLGKLPRQVSSLLVRGSMGGGWSASAVEVMRRYVLQYGVTRNFGFMGSTEFDTLKSVPDWDFLRANQSRLSFLFGVDDHWGPLHLKDEMVKEVPGMEVAVEREGHLHAFCCTREGSSWVARQCARMILSKRILRP